MQPNLSLDQLENTDWGEPTYSSYLVRTCHALRKKPLEEFTIEDLRIMIGQNISLEYLMPLAIPSLVENILAEGDFIRATCLNLCFPPKAVFGKTIRTCMSRLRNFFGRTPDVIEGSMNKKELLKAFEAFMAIDLTAAPETGFSKKRGRNS